VSAAAAPLVPERATLPELREAAAGCRACALWEGTTQTVFGEGPAPAPLMLLGEQPGDREDREGHPFVGPAGRELGEGLQAAGIDREAAYVTNVVKHFSFTPRGKRRIHATPKTEHITACRPWLDAEIAVVDPKVIVVLGATAAKALLGRSFRVTAQRGEPIAWEDGRTVIATVHPSSILRARGGGRPDEDARAEARADFVDDLTAAARLLGRSGALGLDDNGPRSRRER